MADEREKNGIFLEFQNLACKN